MINNVELKELFNRIRNQEKDSFNDLYEKYNKLVFGIALSVCKNNADSEDIVQNVFSKIYSLETSKLPTINEASWLYSVTKNESISFLRKKHSNINMEDIYEVEGTNNDIEEIIDIHTFKKLISGLNEKEKEIMSLKILADMSFDEIGKILNEPVGTVKWRYYKSANFLKLSLSSIAMSIIAFIIGIGTMFKKNSNKVSESIEGTDEFIKSPIEEANTNLGISKSLNEKEKSFRDINISENKTDNENISTSIGNIQEANDFYNISHVSFGLAVLFLIITLVFLILFKKYQLKLKNKTSK